MSRALPDWLPAGRVGRAHGLDGSFYVTRPRPGMLRLGTAIRLAGSEVAITRRAGTDEHPILRVEGVASREAAEALRGADLEIARTAVPPLGEGEYWAEELEGCRVVDGDVPVGVVRRLLGLPSCDVLEVERPGGRDMLVPLIGDAVRGIDVQGGTIDVDLAFLGEADGDGAAPGARG